MSSYESLPSHIKGIFTQLRKYIKNNNLKSITIDSDEDVTFVYLSNVIVKYDINGTTSAVSSPTPTEPTEPTDHVTTILNNVSIRVDEIHDMLIQHPPLASTSTAPTAATTATTVTANDNNDADNSNDAENFLLPRLPNPTDTSIKCTRKIFAYIQYIMKIMKNPPSTDGADFVHHPSINICENYRTKIDELYDNLKTLEKGKNYFEINHNIFQLGYCVKMNTNKEAWSTDQKNAKRGWITYYELIETIIKGLIDDGTWMNHIRKELFNTKVEVSTFRDVGIKVNWPYIQKELESYIGELRNDLLTGWYVSQNEV